jgi:hypothetical protein
MYYQITNGRVSGRFATSQASIPGLLKEDDPVVLAALAVEEVEREQLALKESAYAYARVRAQAYVHAFSKDQNQNAIDALGHVVDAILSHIAGDSAALTAIQTKRAQIKQANPKA